MTLDLALAKKKESPARNYAIICISMYKGDLELLDAMVARLKAKGKTNMSRSRLIRYALRQFGLEESVGGR
ncbi:MAG: hypothetical protein PHC70_05250 [Patescibacteria group bacterium]|nr:hypothetical protein [Patescibacteria group bacterium]